MLACIGQSNTHVKHDVRLKHRNQSVAGTCISEHGLCRALKIILQHQNHAINADHQEGADVGLAAVPEADASPELASVACSAQTSSIIKTHSALMFVEPLLFMLTDVDSSVAQGGIYRLEGCQSEVAAGCCTLYLVYLHQFVLQESGGNVQELLIWLDLI